MAHVAVTSPPAQSLDLPVLKACCCSCSSCPNTERVAGEGGWVSARGAEERAKVCCERGAGQE